MATQRSSRASKTAIDAKGLLVFELQQIHSAESQLAKILPRVQKAVDSEELSACLDTRTEQGERVLKEVESALQNCEANPGRRKNTAAEGLIADLSSHLQEVEAGPGLDAIVVAGLQKTEHYCIAAWGTVKALAQALDESDAAEAMEQALSEGKELDQTLTELAEQQLLPALMESASAEEGEEDDEDAEEEDEEDDEESDDEEEQEETGSSDKGKKSRTR